MLDGLERACVEARRRWGIGARLILCFLRHLSEDEGFATLQQALEKDLTLMFERISSVSDKEIIFVSDELGMGIVPANAMSRVYRDLVGLANQYVARRADKVYLSVAGITVELKERGVEL